MSDLGLGPDIGWYLGEAWGWGNEDYASLTLLNAVQNVVVGANPPYSITDFLAMYPKFGGSGGSRPLLVMGTLSVGSPVITALDTMQGMAPGQYVAAPGIPSGATIVSVNQTDASIILSAAASAAGAVQITFFQLPFVPPVVLNAYIALASASLMQARWLSMWPVAMGLYVAHFATLWMRSDGDVYGSPGQAAKAGLTRGITVSKSAGPVSQGIQLAPGLENIGAWGLTEYGVQLATMAKGPGAGPMLLW